jgi:hypothetical protein
MNDVFPIKKFRTLYFFIFVILLVVVILKIISTGITYDEAWTLQVFVPLSFKEIFQATPCDANNHLLNTIAIKILFKFFGKSLVIARIPNLISFIIFSFFAFKICTEFLKKHEGLLLFLLLLANPFMIDFFCLARGYGMANGLLMASLFMMLKSLKTAEIKFYILSVFLAMGAVLANFTYMYFFTAMISVLVLSLLNKKVNLKNKLKILGIILSGIIILIVSTYTIISKLIETQSFYYGGNISFLKDTLVSVFSYSINKNQWVTEALLLTCFFIVTLILLYILLIVLSIKKRVSMYNMLPVFLLPIVVIINLVHVYFFHSLFLVDRTAMQYLPLLFFTFVYSISLLQSKIINISIIIAGFIFVATFSFHFITSFSLKKTISWEPDAHSIEILNKINSLGNDNNKVYNIDYSWPFESSIKYYLSNENFSNIHDVKLREDRDNYNPQADFYIYYAKSLDLVDYDASNQWILNFEKDTLYKFPSENTHIFTNIKKYE